MKRIALFLAALALGNHLRAQNSPPPPPSGSNTLTTDINDDGSVTFGMYAPNVDKLQINMGAKYEMEQDSASYWSVTTEPNLPGLKFYSLVVGGVSFPDPTGKTYHEGNKVGSGIEIPEEDVDFYELKDVPHGTIRTTWYKSQQTKTWRRLFVYTPPDYDENTDQRYPVLYIQHGAGENERAWRDQGKADMILDNLIADDKAVPMLIVMSNEYVINDIGDGYNSESTNAFFDLFKDELKNDIIPFIEENFRVIPNKDSRAITGLSMGGGISFRIGMRNTDTFGWVGVFSTSLFRGDNGDIFDAEKQAPGILTDPEKYNQALNLLYISNGEQDGSFDYTVRSVKAFQEAGLDLEFVTFPGVHEWKVWRKALHDFAPRLFR